MRGEPTRYERQIRRINDSITQGKSKVTLKLYSSEAKRFRDKLGIPISPNPEELPKDIRKKEYFDTLDISSIKELL